MLLTMVLRVVEGEGTMIKTFVQIIVPSPSTTRRTMVNNIIFLYATEVLTLGLIWANFMTPSGNKMEIDKFEFGNFCC